MKSRAPLAIGIISTADTIQYANMMLVVGQEVIRFLVLNTDKQELLRIE